MRSFWFHKNVLVTGQTGFKGSWLCLWLEYLGAHVSAFALPPATEPSHYSLLSPWDKQSHSIVDIKDAKGVADAVAAEQPEIVFHMAAQALVRTSYQDPLETYAANVMGTAHLLNALRSVKHLQAVIIITTDKVYENEGRGHAFVEADKLGGKDPYSNSKSCAELVTQSFRAAFFQTGAKVVTARAGNVVGGGDWSAERLVPDVVRALIKGEPVALRYPRSVRPWQHVLEPLRGYMLLAERLCEQREQVPTAFNFGPDHRSTITVAEVVSILSKKLGMQQDWVPMPGVHPPEAETLSLDSTLARDVLGWTPKLSMQETIDWTAEWFSQWREGVNPRELSLSQVRRYEALL
ncbi:CDP-glucose 4,6-dehydratase [Variovorax sp. dw_954]|uniref:CDP-glucose 4,6-dehydratase n=1 Tax=Variovorax sp. dw_954 TaxID=2720078 RepID=UPI001BD63207|nr:CDP-glucose 4,6-dehydratase [Variovorax sp. dw_954]